MTERDNQILRLALPSIVSNITVPLLGLIDMAIVGHMGCAAYIGAIAVGSMIFNVIYWVFGFLRMGTSGMTSQAYGRRDRGEVVRLLLRSFIIGLCVSALFIVFQRPLCMLALWAMHPDPSLIPLVTAYFDICIWGSPAMLCLYGLTGWYIGMQNTRIPMLVSILQNVVNIAASIALVYGLDMKIEGVAAGTLIAQWGGFLLAVALWCRYYGRLRWHVHGWKRVLGREAMGRFFVVNRDIFFRTLFLVGVNLFFTAAGARQGTLLLAVNTLLMTFFTLFSYLMDGFAYAGEAMGGRYFGASNMAAFRDTTRHLFLWATGMALVFTIIYMVGGRYFLSLLTDNDEVMVAAASYIGWTWLIPVVGFAAFIFDGLFIGITATRGMLLSCAASAVLFFLAEISLSALLGNHALWLAFLLFLAARGVLQGLLFRKYVKPA